MKMSEREILLHYSTDYVTTIQADELCVVVVCSIHSLNEPSGKKYMNENDSEWMKHDFTIAGVNK